MPKKWWYEKKRIWKTLFKPQLIVKLNNNKDNRIGYNRKLTIVVSKPLLVIIYLYWTNYWSCQTMLLELIEFKLSRDLERVLGWECLSICKLKTFYWRYILRLSIFLWCCLWICWTFYQSRIKRDYSSILTE